MYNSSTNRVVLIHEVKWHGFDGSNTEKDPIPFDFNEDTVRKINTRNDARKKK